jgi:hypothetical protein
MRILEDIQETTQVTAFIPKDKWLDIVTQFEGWGDGDEQICMTTCQFEEMEEEEIEDHNETAQGVIRDVQEFIKQTGVDCDLILVKGS